MGSVVQFPDRRMKADTNYKDCDYVQIMCLDQHLFPVRDNDEENREWYGVAGIWINETGMSLKLIGAFVKKYHAEVFSRAFHDKVSETTEDEWVDNVLQEMKKDTEEEVLFEPDIILEELKDGHQVTDEELTDFSDLETTDE